jgi:hypothetical protein
VNSPVDNSVDKSPKPVDNSVDKMWITFLFHENSDLSTFYPQLFHRFIHRKNGYYLIEF